MTLRERLIELAADAMIDLPYDTVELRNWGESSVPDPTRVLAVAAVDAFLMGLDWHLSHRMTPEFEGDEARGVHRLIAEVSA